MKDNIIIGLDIGSTAIRLVVGQRAHNGEKEELQIIGAVSAAATGINRGTVTSIEDVTSSISACIEKGERIIGVPIESAWVGINGPHIKCEKSRGVVAVSKNNGEISEDDVERAIEAARALSVPPNYEILHVLPVKFTVDSQEDIKDPVGMTGIRLEVETLIIQGLTTQIKNLTKAIYRTGIDIEDLILSPLAAAEAVIGSKQKELGAAIVNIGSSTTSLAVYEEGELLHTAVLPIGSEHITSDVAIGLRCPINLADKIKIEHGSAKADLFNKKDLLDVKDLMEEDELIKEDVKATKRYLAQIIQARVEEIFEKIDEELKKIDRSGMLPAGVYLIGGGSQLRDIVEVAKEKLRLPVCLGSNRNIKAVIDKVGNPRYLTALGLVASGDKFSRSGGGLSLNIPGGEIVGKTVKEITNWFKKLIP